MTASPWRNDQTFLWHRERMAMTAVSGKLIQQKMIKHRGRCIREKGRSLTRFGYWPLVNWLQCVTNTLLSSIHGYKEFLKNRVYWTKWKFGNSVKMCSMKKWGQYRYQLKKTTPTFTDLIHAIYITVHYLSLRNYYVWELTEKTKTVWTYIWS